MSEARRFIGKQGKYQIPNGAIVMLIKTFPKRKCIVRYQDRDYITFVTLLRKKLEGVG
jgi:hypothetical protein